MATKESLEDVLAHYGILGMRWGVRRTPEQLARARGERIRKGKPITPTRAAKKEAKKQGKTEIRVNTKTGEVDKVRIRGNVPTSDDAIRTKVIQEKVKKGGLEALSNEELQTLTQRMNLERQYSNLTNQGKKGSSFHDDVKKGREYVNTAIQVGKTMNEVKQFTNSDLGKDISKLLMKKG